MFPIRYLMAIMGSIGLAIVYGFKVNVSVAIVAMVNHTAVKLSTLHMLESENTTAVPVDECRENNTSNATKISTKDGPFVWNEPLQGLILSAYFWGYMLSLLPGGRMADLLSAKWVMNGSVLLNVVASILSPVAAEIHYTLFIAMRFIQGIGGGVTFPAMHAMVAKWAPPNERSILASIVYAGTALGTVISILLTGIIAANFDWVWVFYIEAALCLIWCTAWWIMIEDSPEEQTRFISQEEKDYIMQSLNHTKNSSGHKEKLPVPWGEVLRSKPFMAILIAHFCSNFGWYMLLIELPTFMNQILKFDMSSNAGVSSMPFLCMWIFTIILSKILAVMQDKKLITVTVSRKIGTLFSSVVPMICLIAVSYVGCNRTLAVILMTIGVTCIGGMYSGFLSNHIDIAPNFAGTLVAITNCVATIPGFVVPIFVGKLTHGNQTIGAWKIIFFATATLYIVEIIVYTIFGSGEEQPWNKTKPTDEEKNDQTLPLKVDSRK
ncbi:Putative inorganic phosphate cotransporter [Habropoda laboriosa]|uniref:Putative inorganic phosphate cotransporter n=1 Tax=Habropoda laboriosa TaxID=597456 RepID=A0A0L7QLU6_9HYME|nr:PREDICTED: putative inorganic phosphate cotransporter [Habropoda laboriosa]KOC59597.1 Putative inorganic phosphate cotransporter [Habropoda laboriosa]